jgi:hypothetical protein
MPNLADQPICVIDVGLHNPAGPLWRTARPAHAVVEPELS